MADRSASDKVPTNFDLLNPTLDAIRSLGGSATLKEITNHVIARLVLPPELTEIPHGEGSQTSLEYNLAWARTYLKQYGLIDNSKRAIWSLTSKGHETNSVDPQAVSRYIKSVRSLATSEQEKTGEEVPRDLEDGLVENDSEETAVWREHLLGILREIPFEAFERLCQRLLRESGFIEVEVTGKSGDGGIDGKGIIRLAGLISFPVLFQCKRCSGSVSASTVRDFRGAMQGRADKGVILTTGVFTGGAYKEATRDGAPPIDLIDGTLLVDRLKELNLGVNTRTVEVVEIDRNWFKAS